MKNNTTLLTVITYGVLLASASVLINDIRAFSMEHYTSFIAWSETADKNDTWFNRENIIKWTYYAINAAILMLKAYLIYGFTYFISILNEIGKGQYFSTKNIGYFKKIGHIFISYTIAVLILRFVLAITGQSNFNFMQEFKEEFTLLIPCGLAFYLLAEIFDRAKNLEEENELTI